MAVSIGVDLHVRTQTVCWLDTADGEQHEVTLDHERNDVTAFYSQFAVPATVGVEASGYSRCVAAYCGLDPREHSSGDSQRFGHISKQGDRLLRFLLIEAPHNSIRDDDDLRRFYFHSQTRKNSSVASSLWPANSFCGSTACFATRSTTTSSGAGVETRDVLVRTLARLLLADPLMGLE